MVAKISIAIASFLAGLIVYDVFFVDSYLESKETPNEQVEICPSRSSFVEVWDKWTDTFIAENPGAGSEAQLQEWNDLMVGIGCPEWVDPFRNVVATTTYTDANGSTTEIYQYELPE